MSISRVLALACFLMFACAAGPASAAQQPAAPTNFVIILVDDWGWTDVGFTGGKLDFHDQIGWFADTRRVLALALSASLNTADRPVSNSKVLERSPHARVEKRSGRQGASTPSLGAPYGESAF